MKSDLKRAVAALKPLTIAQISRVCEIATARKIAIIDKLRAMKKRGKKCE